MSDIVFTDARITDGTGAPSFRGRVSVKNDKIEEAPRNEAPDADGVVNVDEAILAPGFTEAYSHSDFEVLEDPFLTPRLHQGITTEILGQDGPGLAPVSSGHVDEWSV